MVIFNRFLLIFLVSFSGLFAKGLGEIAHLPYVQKFITNIFEKRGLSPNQFNFKFIPSNNGLHWFYYCSDNRFEFDLSVLENVEKIYLCSLPCQALIYGGKIFGTKTAEEYLLCVEGLIGHEIIHSLDREALIKYWRENYFSCNFDRGRQEFEVRADLGASKNPKVLRALANLCENFPFSPCHPVPVERSRYLRKKAYQIEAEQRQSMQKEQERYLMFSN